MTVTQLMTAEDLWEMPEVPGKRFELVRGELVEMAGASYSQAQLVKRLVLLLDPIASSDDFDDPGEVFGDGLGYVLARDPDVVRVPDVSFISRRRILKGGPMREGFVPFAPDLAVEIVSPNDRANDVRAKVTEYLEGGTRLVWVFWPGFRSISVHAPGNVVRERYEKDTLDGGYILPGFRVRVGDLFVGAGK